MTINSSFRSLAPLSISVFLCLYVNAIPTKAELVGPNVTHAVAARDSQAFSLPSTWETSDEDLASEINPAVVRRGTPLPELNIEGMSSPCGDCTPSDATGDVSSTHYVQAVNGNMISVFTNSGVILPGYPKPLKSLWAGRPGNCDQSTSGNTVVIYDDLANRWFLAQTFEGKRNGICVAVSKTSDATGAYHLYEFATGNEFPGNFKFGAWPSAYYMASRESTYAAYAFDRAKMLEGKPAGFIRFAGESNFLLPADVDGSSSPKATASGLFYTFKSKSFHGGTDRLELFSFQPDFVTPSKSTFKKTASFDIEPFGYPVCRLSHRNCIPQKGTAQKLDARSNWPSSRLAYRVFADASQSLAGNFTVRGAFVGAETSAIRWFELRNLGGGWSLEQEGTIDSNDGVSRFNGSVAIDQAGNLALGYTASSPTLFPDIRYAVHLRNPSNFSHLEPERTLITGAGAQTGSSRWGGSTMSVEAVRGTFWFTSQYYPATSSSGWHTRIGKFRVIQTSVFRSIGANDGYIVETRENSNVGGAISPASKVLRLGDTSTDQQTRIILDFNTDSLPDSAVIVGVDLRIKRSNSPVGRNPFTFASEIEVHENLFTSSFSGSVALQPTDFEVDPGGPVGLIRTPPLGDWYIANPMEDNVKNTGHTQFRLEFNADDNNNETADYLRLHSGDAVNVLDRPRLTIKYYVP